jgi:hypothetical protein
MWRERDTARTRDVSGKVTAISALEFPYLWLLTFAGYLKAVWPGFGGERFLGMAGPGGPGRRSKRWGVKPPTSVKVFPGPRGRPDLKNAPKHSGQIAFRYPILLWLGTHFGRTKDDPNVSGRRLGQFFMAPGPNRVVHGVWPGGQVWSRCADREQEIRTKRFRARVDYTFSGRNSVVRISWSRSLHRLQTWPPGHTEVVHWASSL